MINGIRKSLSLQIFIFTCLITIACCLLTYFFLAWYMPQIEVSDTSNQFEQQAKELALEFDSLSPQECYYLMTNISLPDGISIHVFRNDREVVFPDLSDGNKAFSHYSDSNITSKYSFFVYGIDDPLELMLLNDQINSKQLIQNALENAFPVIVAIIAFISVLSAFIYSTYIAKPIVQLSINSKKLANLDFSAKCKTSRIDEIGALAKDFNRLSDNLESALISQKRLNAILQKDIERERKLEQKRIEFYAAASHELKTPLTIIKGQIEGMLNNVGSYKDREKYLSRSLQVLSKLEKTILELIDISRMDSPHLAMQVNRIELSGFITAKLKEYEDHINLRKMEVLFGKREPSYISANYSLLTRVFDNLISNALFYSPEKQQILIDIYNDNEDVVFKMENTGASISHEDLPRLFEAFYRADKSRNQQSGGSGLGLYIVKTILDSHNAQYEITSGIDSVVFTIRFPRISNSMITP